MKKNTLKKMTLLIGCFLFSLTASAQITSAGIGNWNETTTWVGGVVPTSSDDVTILHRVTIPSGENAVAKSIFSGASPAQIIIRESASLTVVGNIILTRTNDGIFVFGYGPTYKMGTIIFGGINVNRTRIRQSLPRDEWHLVSHPFLDSRIDFTTHPTNAIFNNLVDLDGGKKSLAFYNDSLDEESKYVFYNQSPKPPGTMKIAGGYLIKVDDLDFAGGTTHEFTMTGIMHEGSVFATISDAGKGYNLVGNPYLSYLNANTAAHATNNLLSANASVLEEQTIWLWDGINKVFVTKNLGDEAFRVNPIQGFFVKAKAGGGLEQSLGFNKNMESHISTNPFSKTSTGRFEVGLSLTINGVSKKTSIRYDENQTTDFDNGYDSSIFDGYSTFDGKNVGEHIFTELIQNNTGKKLAIQSLPNSDYENMIIPLGVNATAGIELTFSAEVLNLPTGIQIFIEDRALNTMTRLDEADTSYKVTTSDALSSSGRFYLHTKSNGSLSTDSLILQSVSVYKTADDVLIINGLKGEKASIKLYNILGKQIMNNQFQPKGVTEIALPKLAKGLYIVQIETEMGNLNKKIILE